ncbi:hypothetical protein OG897_03310 [Streptomyces sp. NBC_00237]|nr:hypothetical protein [Streptomyces sp. NBC_00237]MCX5200493.1 hypothetical protein [Streptomyces sp. NBC_00237]
MPPSSSFGHHGTYARFVTYRALIHPVLSYSRYQIELPATF